MKILFLARYLPQEGSTIHIYTLVHGLINRGHEVHVISAGPKNDKSATKLFDEMIGYGMQHHQVNFPLNPSFSIKGKLYQLLRYLLFSPKALYMLFKVKPDVIHVHYPVTAYLAKIYGRLTGKKFITTHHASGIPKHPLHQKADFVIAISRELEMELIGNYRYTKEQVRLIFNGVSSKKFNRRINLKEKLLSREKLGIPKNKFIIGFVGGYTQNKGIDILFEAVAKLEESEFSVCLVGDGDVEWVNSLINRYNLQGRVNLFSFQDPVSFYSSFDVLVLPSRKEGFPLVPLEAMLMGLPVIRSNVQGANDQIDHGICGYIFESEDSNELCHYLNMLMKDELLRESMGKKANENAVRLFTDEIMIDKILNLYKESLNIK